MLLFLDASFSESFYSLVRTSNNVDSSQKRVSLSRRDRWKSLFFIVILPYIKSKLDKKFSKVSGRVDEDEEEFASSIQRETAEHSGIFKKYAVKLFITLYPYFHLIYEGLLLIYQIAYMYDYTRFYDWFLHIQNIRVDRLLLQDLVSFNLFEIKYIFIIILIYILRWNNKKW